MVEVGKRVRKQEEENPVCFRVDEMVPEGKGKIRYIGGWAVRKRVDATWREMCTGIAMQLARRSRKK